MHLPLSLVKLRDIWEYANYDTSFYRSHIASRILLKQDKGIPPGMNISSLPFYAFSLMAILQISYMPRKKAKTRSWMMESLLKYIRQVVRKRLFAHRTVISHNYTAIWSLKKMSRSLLRVMFIFNAFNINTYDLRFTALRTSSPLTPFRSS